MIRGIGLFFQILGLVLLPSVFLWAVMDKISARLELTMLAIGAALFYVGSLINQKKS